MGFKSRFGGFAGWTSVAAANWCRVSDAGPSHVLHARSEAGVIGVGFRMPARRMYCTRALRPASESPPGRNPRAAMRPGAVYGDLAGQRFGQGVLRLVWL